ncbi:MAG TPA: bifunctional phosphopantothenoylcysteine decarboxylase/phosphopantothenate--cysteine ligase CoaBC [Gammaproteobacteria bacterium]|nr:bifunctional phosphopantothenoylcysteine decarboxylase/phosphopantothenate--cysteine ligase CoaBC [Gammaproteobacteria bacterium]
MNLLAGKRILLGISGGIAAYKSAELVRLLRAAGAEVRVLMTAAATGFVGAQTFQALSGQPVYCDWNDEHDAMGHIELARWADFMLVAPATADTLARLAQGRADDLLAAVCLASEAPLAVAPAMNRGMWQHPATRANVSLLRERGVHVWGPAEGEQACGESGPGRMLEPTELLQALSQSFASGRLAGVEVVVTAGPTREPLDPVRFLSNRSSGKMGYALATAARDAGARVTLVSGPVALEAPEGVERVLVETAQEMLQAVLERMEGCRLFIATAAVADYRPRHPAQEKIKKQADELVLRLEPAPDILATVAARTPRPVCVGFAAETQELERYAHRKRLAKGVEMIAANRVGAGLGFDSDDNELLLVWEGGSRRLARDRKSRLARQLVDEIATRYFPRSGEEKAAGHHAKYSA